MNLERITILLMLTLSLSGPGQPASEMGPVRAIQAALQAKDYAQALELTKPELQRSPRDARLSTLEGLAFTGLGRSQEALAAYDKALASSPNFLPALEGAAQLEYQSRSPRTIKYLNRILDIRPNDPTSHAMLATLAYLQHDCTSAVKDFELSQQLISSRPDALAEYGTCLINLARPKDAIPVFQQILAASAGDPHVLYDLAVAQIAAQQDSDALGTLQPLLESERPDPDVLDLASVAYEDQGNTPKAVELLRRAIVSNPKEVRYYLDFATISFTHKSFQVGIDMVSAGIQVMPMAAPLYVARGVLYIQLGNYEKSEADFKTAARIDPKNSSGAVARGLSQIQQGDLDEALATVRMQLREHPKVAFLYYMKAQILDERGALPGSPEFNEAISSATQATRMSPDLILPRDLLGKLYMKSGQLNLAIKECRIAIQNDPSDQNALYTLIQSLRRSGNGSKAEMMQLVKRLEDLRRETRKQEASESQYRLYEISPTQDSNPVTPNE